MRAVSRSLLLGLSSHSNLRVCIGVGFCLVRYGALMWSLGKVIQTPEVVRVYIGSFWDQPLRYTENRALFEAEMRDLINDLKSLPKNNAMRKVRSWRSCIVAWIVYGWSVDHYCLV